MTWSWKCFIFAQGYVGLEGNKHSRLKPSWRPHHHWGRDIRSVNRGFVVGCCIDEPFFSYDIMLTSMFAMMMLMFEHTHNRLLGDAQVGS